MTEKKGNGLDRFQQALHMYGHQNVFEHDLLKRANELQKVTSNIVGLVNDVYITKDVATESFEKELTEALSLTTQISTSLGLKLSELAINKIKELKENGE